MNGLDIVVMAICLISTLVGFVRGFISSLLGTCGWTASILGNHYLFQSIEPFLKARFSSKFMTFLVGYVGGLIVLLLIFSVVNFIVSSILDKFRVGFIDKFAGAVFGLARGFLISIVSFLCFDIATTILWGNKSEKMIPNFIMHSASVPVLKQGEIVLLEYLPNSFKINLSLYRADLHSDNVSEITLLNLVRKMSSNVPLKVLKTISLEDDKYISRKQCLMKQIGLLWEYHMQNKTILDLSDSEKSIIQSII